MEYLLEFWELTVQKQKDLAGKTNCQLSAWALSPYLSLQQYGSSINTHAWLYTPRQAWSLPHSYTMEMAAFDNHSIIV